MRGGQGWSGSVAYPQILPFQCKSCIPVAADAGTAYQAGRFATLTNVVDHYNTCKGLRLLSGEKSDLVPYLLSLMLGPKEAATCVFHQ